MTQTRWICGGCDREWVWAHQWEPKQGCPLCGHEGIRQETYRPAFPGADVPRNMAGLMDAYQQATEPTPISVAEHRNHTLAASSPEFDS